MTHKVRIRIQSIIDTRGNVEKQFKQTAGWVFSGRNDIQVGNFIDSAESIELGWEIYLSKKNHLTLNLAKPFFPLPVLNREETSGCKGENSKLGTGV